MLYWLHQQRPGITADYELHSNLQHAHNTATPLIIRRHVQ